jgi:hypothetical protein
MTTSAPLLTLGGGATLEGMRIEDQTVEVVIKKGGISGRYRKRG